MPISRSASGRARNLVKPVASGHMGNHATGVCHMSFKTVMNPDNDHEAEADTIADFITESEFDYEITHRQDNVIEYVCREGDPPFCKYRVTVDKIGIEEQSEDAAA